MSGLQDAAIQVAETIQTAHINESPSIHRDLAPSTAADTKQPVIIDRNAGVISDADEDEIPLSILKPFPAQRQPPHMQLPDLRFEQSYLKSIGEAKDWRAITYITVKDQVLMPLVQGMAWTLLVAWWRHWNTATKFGGHSVGARIRRWWWGVNDWKIPDQPRRRVLRDETLASEIKEFASGPANAGFD